MHYHQCELPVLKDGYCRVHHPDAVKARREASHARYEEIAKRSPWNQLKTAHDRINALRRALSFYAGKLRPDGNGFVFKSEPTFIRGTIARRALAKDKPTQPVRSRKP